MEAPPVVHQNTLQVGHKEATPHLTRVCSIRHLHSHRILIPKAHPMLCSHHTHQEVCVIYPTWLVIKPFHTEIRFSFPQVLHVTNFVPDDDVYIILLPGSEGWPLHLPKCSSMKCTMRRKRNRDAKLMELKRREGMKAGSEKSHPNVIPETDDSSDEDTRANQACVLSSPVVMLGSCIVSLVTVLFCKMRVYHTKWP